MRRALASALLALAAAGCVSTAELARVGLSEADILALEAGGWENQVRIRNLEPETRPLAVRDLHCTRPRGVEAYRCFYALEFGVPGSVPRAMRRRQYLGHDEDGRWEFLIIVSSG